MTTLPTAQHDAAVLHWILDYPLPAVAAVMGEELGIIGCLLRAGGRSLSAEEDER